MSQNYFFLSDVMISVIEHNRWKENIFSATMF